MSETSIQLKSTIFCVHNTHVIVGKVVGASLREKGGKESPVYSVKPEDPKQLAAYGVIPVPEHRAYLTRELAEKAARREALDYDIERLVFGGDKILRYAEEILAAGDSLPMNPNTGNLRVLEKLDAVREKLNKASEVFVQIPKSGFLRKFNKRTGIKTDNEPLASTGTAQGNSLGAALDEALAETCPAAEQPLSPEAAQPAAAV